MKQETRNMKVIYVNPSDIESPDFKSRESSQASSLEFNDLELVCQEYIKVGTTLYRKVNVPAATPGKYLGERLEVWNKATILEDYDRGIAKAIFERMDKYKAFVVRPEHLNYERDVEGCYNHYEPLKHRPSEQAEDFPNTKGFLQHIFGDQYEIGLDYLQLLYKRPLQKLYILCLVSVERNTGKTTFLNWLRLIFGKNVTLIGSEDVEGRFNSDWTTKLIIGIDETFIDSKKAAERIKSLSTTKVFKTEAKQKDKVETEFFGKFIFASNNVTNFLPIEEGEIRYWVRYVKPLGSDNVNLLDDLEAEIPAFLHHLLNRQMHTPKPLSRMWHNPQDVWTPDLQLAMCGNRSSIEELLIESIKEYYLDFNDEMRKQGLDESWLKLALKDMQKLMTLYVGGSVRYNRVEVRRVISEKWGLRPVSNSSYKYYTWIEVPDGDEQSKMVVHGTNCKGRYFVVPIEKLGL